MSATAAKIHDRLPEEDVIPLEAGDHLDQKTFHARYEAMPEDLRAELIGGVVYMPSPLKARHGRSHPRISFWLSLFQAATPGTDVVDNATIIMAEDSEPQPDNALLIHPEYGGQTHENDDGYLVGSPELIVEMASSRASYDLHSKRRDYERHGVGEYMVVVLQREEIIWFVRRGATFQSMQPGGDGIFRSEAFPGLWLDPAALFRGDMQRLQEVLQHGLRSPEHSAFCEQLRNRRNAGPDTPA